MKKEKSLSCNRYTKGNFLTSGLNHTDIVLVFVERHQEGNYKSTLEKQIQSGSHVLVVLPDRWKGRGAPLVREVCIQVLE